MEVVAGFRSLVGTLGIVGLVGQFIGGLFKLRMVIRGVATASKRPAGFLKDFKSL